MKDRELIVQLLAEMGSGWNSLSKQMTWNFRRGVTEPPSVFVLTTGIRTMPTRAEWVALRKEVISFRRRAEYQEKKQIEAALAERRRTYMRGYMRRYRSRKPTEENADASTGE